MEVWLLQQWLEDEAKWFVTDALEISDNEINLKHVGIQIWSNHLELSESYSCCHGNPWLVFFFDIVNLIFLMFENFAMHITVFLLNSASFTTFSFSPIIPTYFPCRPYVFLYFLLSLLCPFSDILLLHDYRTIYWSKNNLSRAASLKKIYSSFLNRHQLTVASQLGVELHESLPTSCWDFGWLHLVL